MVGIVNSGRSEKDLAMHLMRTPIQLSISSWLWQSMWQASRTKQLMRFVGIASPCFIIWFHRPTQIHSQTARASGPPGNRPARLDLQRLEDSVRRYFKKVSTQHTYRSGQEQFCGEVGLKPIPVIETGLCSFIAQLADQKLRHRTIKTYLSAVRH